MLNVIPKWQIQIQLGTHHRFQKSATYENEDAHEVKFKYLLHEHLKAIKLVIIWRLRIDSEAVTLFAMRRRAPRIGMTPTVLSTTFPVPCLGTQHRLMPRT
jgi:hypothetical protein